MTKGKRISKALRVLLILSVIAAIVGCSSKKTTDGASSPSASKATATGSNNTTELKKVKFGLLPYQDWMPWVLAQDEGYLKEVGLDVQFMKFTDDITAAEAVQSGDIDMASANSASGPLTFSRFKDLRVVSLACGFTGYSIMVRPDDIYPKGKYKTYDQFYQEEIAKGTSAADAVTKAVANTTKQLQGHKIVMDRGTGSNLPLQAALLAGGLKDDQMKFIDMPDVEGALAFWDGTGDFEIGGYPQVISLSKLGAKKLISAKELGGISVILSGEIAKADWAEQNTDTIVKMRQAWYKVINDIYTKPEMLDKFAAVVNKWQGTDLKAEEMKGIIKDISYWPKQDEVNPYFFAGDAKWNANSIYTASLDYWVNVKKQVKDGSVDLKKSLIVEDIFNQLNASK